MKNITELASGFVDAEEKLNNAKEIIVFGASSGGRKVKTYLETSMKLRVHYFVDNDPKKWDTIIEDVPILSPFQLSTLYSSLANPLICIASDWAKDIACQLREMGIKNYIDLTYWFDRSDCFDYNELVGHLMELERVYSLLVNEQSRETFLSILEYRKSLDPICLKVSEFDQYCHPCIDFAGCRVLFDVGAWTGDTAIKFAKLMSKESKIVAFEPTPDSLILLCQNIHEKGFGGKVIPVTIAVSDKSGYAWLRLNSISSSNYIASSGDILVRVTALDDFINETGMVPDIIKMDIEGSEMAALCGLKDTIINHHPNLQVCIYHRCEDLWGIPLFLKNLQPCYKFYIGHHAINHCETVLYAVCN